MSEGVEVFEFSDAAPNGAASHAPFLLDDVHQLFRRWLGEGYDMDVLNAVLAAAAVQRLDGDPVWVMVVGGPGNSKTETVQSLAGADATIVTSTFTSDAALLSASPKKSKVKGATGGLLRVIGDAGTIVCKDFTSTLAMNANLRGLLLAALREIFDGRWERNVGVDGGQTLTWEGRVTMICACTSAWDAAHGVISSMGDRFVVIRASGEHREENGRQALKNTGKEVAMRSELSKAVAALLSSVQLHAFELSQDEHDRLFAIADLVTYVRTAVQTDQRGDVIDGHEPELPTRFGKQLLQIVRGGLAIGLKRDDALRLAIRCAHDTLPPLRLLLLEAVAASPLCSTADVRDMLNKPVSTCRRGLEALQVLGIIRGNDSHQWQIGTRANMTGLQLLLDFRKGLASNHQAASNGYRAARE